MKRIWKKFYSVYYTKKYQIQIFYIGFSIKFKIYFFNLINIAIPNKINKIPITINNILRISEICNSPLDWLPATVCVTGGVVVLLPVEDVLEVVLVFSESAEFIALLEELLDSFADVLEVFPDEAELFALAVLDASELDEEPSSSVKSILTAYVDTEKLTKTKDISKTNNIFNFFDIIKLPP